MTARRIVCIGGAVFDRKYRAKKDLIAATSNPVNGFRSHGGVARNVTENLARLGVDIGFVSIVGNDENGRSLLEHLVTLGVDAGHVVTSDDGATAEYIAVLDPQNELALGLADMDIFELLQPARLEQAWPAITSADWVFADCNLPRETLAALISRKADAHFRLAIDAVSTPKAQKLRGQLAGIDLLFLNHDEADAILDIAPAGRLPIRDTAAALLAAGAKAVILTGGGSGYVVAGADGIEIMSAVPAQPVDITGAGDAMIAGTLYRLLAGEPVREASRTGALLATLTTESAFSVRPDLSPELLTNAMPRIS
ncbi:MAG: carbohydrate kinase family protein [Rhizobiaceae bacterium]